MPRQARLDAEGMLHHIIIRGIERRNIFRTDSDRDDFINRLTSLLPETKTLCYAWAFIPNHAHFLFRSGPSGIAYLMRKLLTGYAVSFNHRYSRSGQLFQNRYKSIICQEDIYFKELVRYIHLNPLRAGIVPDLEDLDRFPYSGHSAIMGMVERPWQETGFVLDCFSENDTECKRAYRSYLEAAIGEGRREDLAGGGLVRSLGGWRPISSNEAKTKGDQRILGHSDFVLRVLSEAEEQLERRYALKSQGYSLEKTAQKIAALYGLEPEDVLSKGRERARVEARSLFCYVAANELGASVTDIARRLGMTPSAVSYSVSRGKNIAQDKGFRLYS
jgi:putative transposase